jgi:hypothetical protein
MSLPRSCSHNRPTNLRNKPKLKATQKHKSRSKGLRQSASGQSAKSWRTVRGTSQDSPQMLIEQTEPHLEIRMVRTLPADDSRATCAAQTVHDP